MAIYYRSTISETDFEPAVPDPDHYGLERYREADITAIVGFIERGLADLMVIGGISGAGKSTILKQISAADRSVQYHELGTMGEFNHQADCTTVILDEGTWALEEGQEPRLTYVEMQITSLVRRGIKVLLAGGGSAYTGPEQADELTRNLAPGILFTKHHHFQLKTLNTRQAAELIMLKSACSIELATVVAEAVSAIHRIPKIISSPRIMYPDSWYQYPNAPYSLIIPAEIRRETGNIQREAFSQVALSGHRASALL